MKPRLSCDGFGCEESHPLEHEDLGDEHFGTGRWLGWLYLDLNRPDLFDREMRFCGVGCCLDWLERQRVRPKFLYAKETPTPLDLALRRPNDVVARARAGLKRTVARTGTTNASEGSQGGESA